MGSSASDVRREAWAGVIPAVFTLAADEVTTLEKPRPYHTCIPRQALLPFVAERLREFFSPHAPPIGRSEAWFEHSSGVFATSVVAFHHAVNTNDKVLQLERVRGIPIVKKSIC